MTNSYSEDILIEQPTIALFETLAWETVNCYRETFGTTHTPGPSPRGRGETLGRETSNEVVLTARLRPALELLQEDHRYLFTLIQKFRTDKGRPIPCSRSAPTSSSPTRLTVASGSRPGPRCAR